MLKLLNPGGTMIFIETLGTNFASPEPPTPVLKQFYQILESLYGFSRTLLQTDYKFDSNEQAADITGFFFGEFTGVWLFQR